jgi:hypothetical protein
VGLNKKNPLIYYLFVARVNLHPAGHNCWWFVNMKHVFMVFLSHTGYLCKNHPHAST